MLVRRKEGVHGDRRESASGGGREAHLTLPRLGVIQVERFVGLEGSLVRFKTHLDIPSEAPTQT